MGKLKVAPPDDSLWPTVSAAIDAAFLSPLPVDKGQRERLRPMDRRLALMDDHRAVGGCIAYDLEMMLPGGAVVPAAGLAGVGILPTEQGKGGLRLLLEAHLNNCRVKGDAVSVLMASESGLYSRFAYAAATEWASYRLATKAFALKPSVPADSGRIVLIRDLDEARQLCAQVHASQKRAGEVQRSTHWWEEVIHNNERSWLGGGEQFIAIHRNSEGRADAYALYVIEEMNQDGDLWHGNQCCRLELRELVSLDALAQAAMIQYLCNIAWVRELRWELAPVDPPVKHLMTDPRQLSQIARFDMLWCRVLDMPRLLMEHSYTEQQVLDFNYEDAQFPELSGGFRLTTSSDAKTANLVEQLDDGKQQRLSLGAEQLAAVVLGGTRVVSLYQLGMIKGDEEKIRLLDRLLLTDTAPFNLSKF